MEHPTPRITSIGFRSDGKDPNEKSYAKSGCAPGAIHEKESGFYSLGGSRYERAEGFTGGFAARER